jgi:hypothetical protein
MMVAERKGKEIQACCRGGKEKGSFRNKCRSLKGRGKGYKHVAEGKGRKEVSETKAGC